MSEVSNDLPFDLDSGLPINTRAYILVGDLDVASGYPNGTLVFNTSRETTKKEVVKYEGMSQPEAYLEGINLSGGPTNAHHFCMKMFDMPSLFEWDELMTEGKI